jgi:hypothetical protein
VGEEKQIRRKGGLPNSPHDQCSMLCPPWESGALVPRLRPLFSQVTEGQHPFKSLETGDRFPLPATCLWTLWLIFSKNQKPFQLVQTLRKLQLVPRRS